MPTPINISASRGASVLGLSGYQSQIDVWLEIQESRNPGFCAAHGYKLPEREYNAAMQWGHAFESAIIELAEQKLTNIGYRELFFEKDFMTCHIDGAYCENENGQMLLPKPDKIKTIHEGKTTSQYYFRDNFGEPGTDKIPREYQVQCQHQLICTEAEKVILSVLVFPKRVEEFEALGFKVNDKESMGDMVISYYANDKFIARFNPMRWATVLSEMGYFHQYHITPNVELQKLMIDRYTEFWQKNIIEQIMPEPANLDDIKKIYRSPVGTVILDENMEYLMAELSGIRAEIGGTGNLAKRADMIKTQVLDFARKQQGTLDDDSADKMILRGRDGKKLGSYFKNKNGVLVFK